jgi:hypothetical protein
MADRHFWHEMTYRCNACGATIQMRLEDGCEGPKAFSRTIRILATGDTGVQFFTKDRYPVIPVPFGIACMCNQHGAYKEHDNWRGDKDIDITVPDGQEPDFPHFAYDPSAMDNPRACGIPKGHR